MIVALQLHFKYDSGVYQLICLPTRQVYIGSTSNFQRRWKEHRDDLANRYHSNYRLQRAWNIYGPSAFVFEIVERTVPSQRLLREQVWIDTLKPYFNIQSRVQPLRNEKVYNRLQSARRTLHRRHTRSRYTP
jgi:group I intron endonuclease